MDDERELRLLRADEMRPAFDLFLGALHVPPVSDANWEGGPIDDFAGRTFGVFDGGELAGTTWSFPSRTAVPGGTALPTAAVTRVGVRADRTRRGHLRSLMHAQLADAAGRGEVLATLTASETGIYGRFGYGVATRGERVRVRPRAGLRAGFRADAPPAGDIRMPPRDRAVAEAVALYERIVPGRPGTMVRTPQWWQRSRSRFAREERLLGTAVHAGPDGDDGFAVWTVDQGEDTVVRVLDLMATNPASTIALWRFVLGMDLVDGVSAEVPLDEPLGLVLADPRELHVEGRGDALWMRLLDVPAALAARTWGDAAPVVLRVHDPLFAANDVAFRIGPDGAKPAEDVAAPDLECTVDALAMAYLGDRRPSQLVTTGWWRSHDPSATDRADALFATAEPPWCGTFF